MQMSISSLAQRVVMSGIQPTGVPHIGNWLGAIDQWTKLQNSSSTDSEMQVFVCIADLHSITVPHQPHILRFAVVFICSEMLQVVFAGLFLKYRRCYHRWTGLWRFNTQISLNFKQ